MPSPEQTCVLPDGSAIDLSDASPDEAKSCLIRSKAIIRLELADPTGPLPQEGIVVEPTNDHHVEPANPEPIAPALVAQAVQPDPEPSTTLDVAHLMQSSGGGLLGLAAAMIAVVGGTAGFKLWTKISEQKHEQQMKRLDIEQANAGLSGSQPPACQTAHQTAMTEIKALQGRVTEMESRLVKVERLTAGINPSVDVDDLEERVKSLEKSLRRKSTSQQGVS